MVLVDNAVKLQITQQDIDNASKSLETRYQEIASELQTLLTKETYDTICKEAPDLIKRIDKIIYILTQRKAQAALKNLPKKIKQYENTINNPSSKDDAKEKAYESIRRAQEALAEASATLQQQVANNIVREALKDGYMIINQIRAMFFDEIEYKITMIGKDSSGNNVLYESHPTMIEVLQSTSFDGSGNGALKLSANLDQFKKVIKASENADYQLKMQNTVLQKMQKVEMLRPGDQPLLDLFVELKDALWQSGIEGSKMNYGQLTEAYLDNFFNGDTELTVQSIYSLLEKGRNNLDYYFGGDINVSGVDYQVKSLSFYGKTGRADAATLTNVLNPLIQIRELLTNTDSVQDVEKSLKKFFTPKEGQGDRPFKTEVEKEIKQVIRETMVKLGFEIT